MVMIVPLSEELQGCSSGVVVVVVPLWRDKFHP